MMNTNNTGLKKATEFYNKAKEEYTKAKEDKSDILFRDAAEKGWNAIVLSTNYLIKKIIGKTVKGNRERREELSKLEKHNGNFKKYRFRERFMARAYFLHMNCFYDGIYTIDELEEELDKVEIYIKDVESTTK